MPRRSLPGATRTRTLAPAATLAVAALLTGSLSAQTQVVAEHSGASDPLTEGWQLYAYDGVDYQSTPVTPAGTSVGPVVDDLGAGFAAWEMVDASATQALVYARPLSQTQIDAASQLGWSLYARVRVESGSASGSIEPVELSYETLDRTWSIYLNRSGNDLVARLAEGADAAAGRATTLPSGAAGYHSLELRWDATQGTADLFVDGQLALADSPGLSSASALPGTVRFGVACVDCAGDALFSEVTWSLSPSTPPGADLLAYFPFDGNLNNASGSSITATAFGWEQPTPTDGVRGEAFHFDGGDHVRTSILQAGLDRMTFGAWARTQAVTQQWLFTSHDGIAPGGVNVLITAPGGTWAWTAWNGGLGVVVGEPIELDAWEFVAVSVDRTAPFTRLHVNDNVYERPFAASGGITLSIGRSDYWTRLGFVGDIDEVFAFSRVLGSNELRYVREHGPLAEDSDGDGVPDSLDVCPFTPDPAQLDSDGDGVGDACDLCPGFDDALDLNGNGVPDGCDCTPVAVVTPPVSATVCAGQDVTLTVEVSGDESNTFQWFADGAAIPGATSDVLSLAAVDAADAGVYTVEASNDCGGDSASATLTVVDLGPAIASGPQGATLCPGDSLTLSVSATPINGGALLYQWRKDGVDLPGETASSFFRSSVATADSGQYDVVVDEVDCGLTTSAAALVTVEDPPPVVTLNGPSLVTVECGVESYVEYGAAAADTCDGDLTVTIDGPSVDSTVPGTTQLTYAATDSAGQTASVLRTVVVRDTTPPVFTVVPGDLTLTCGDDGSAFSTWLSSAAASDDCGAVSVRHEVSFQGPCGTCEALVTWTATDESGNSATTSAVYTEMPDTSLAGVVFAPAEVVALPEGAQEVIHLVVRNDGACPSQVVGVTVVPDPNGVAASLHPSFAAPFLICPGQSLAIPIEVDTTGVPGGTYRPEVVLEGATVAAPVSGTAAVRVSGEVLPNLTFAAAGGLVVTSDGGAPPLQPYSGFTLEARVRNNGAWPSSATSLNFFEGTNFLGSTAVPALPVGASVQVDLPVAGGLPEGFYLLRAEIVPPVEGELSSEDNGLGVAVQAGAPPGGGAVIDVQAAVGTSCEGARATVSGRAEYVIDNGISVFRFPVQGALVSVHVDGADTSSSQARTVLDGSFSFPVRFQAAASYDLLITVTDFTLTGEQGIVYTVTNCTRGGTPGEPGPLPRVDVPVNLSVCHDDVVILGTPISPGGDAVVEATVHYYNASGAALADQPVSFYALEQTALGFERRFLGSRVVSFDGGGSVTVGATWSGVPAGDHVILVELDPTVSQWDLDDAATRGLSVAPAGPEFATSIAIEFDGAGGCTSAGVSVSGKATYVRAEDEPPGAPVACGAVTVRVFDGLGTLLGEGDPAESRADGRFLASSPASGGLTPGQYVLEVTVTDGTWSTTELVPLACAEPGGGGYNVPTDYTGFDLYVYSEDIAFTAADCFGALFGWPSPGDLIGLRVTFHYTGAYPLSGIPAEVVAHVPIGGELVPVPVGTAVLDFPVGSGFDTHCFPWTPELAQPTIVQAVIDSASLPGQFNGNDAATRLLFVGNAECDLSLPSGSFVVPPGELLEVPIRLDSYGSSTPFVDLSLTADPSGALPDGVSVSFSPSSLTLPGETVMTIQTAATTPATTHQLLVMATGGGCTALGNFLLEVNTPPAADCGGNITVEASEGEGALVTLDASASADPDFDSLVYQWDVGDPSVELDDPTAITASGVFPVGVTTVTLTVIDSRGGVGVCSLQVSVEDTTPPEVQCATDPIVLWPPNHQMVPVTLAVQATDAVSDASALTLVSVTIASDEEDDATGKGDGTTEGDVAGLDGFSAPVDVTSLFAFDGPSGAFVGTVDLRAERAGTGDGRFYTIEAQVIDSSGNLATTTCGVVVPHDRRKKK